MFTLEDRVLALKQSELFRALAPEVQAMAAKLMEERDVPGQTVLFHEGDPGDAVYFLATGAVEIYKGRDEAPHVLAVLEPPEFFGEMAVLSEGLRSSSARTKTDCVLLTLGSPAVRVIVEKVPDASFSFFRVLCRRLDRTNEYVASLREKQRARAVLAVVEGPEQKTFTLTRNRVEIGRGSISDVEDGSRMNLRDPTLRLERNHAEVLLRTEGFHLQDLNSTSGTFLNGERVDGTASLRAGDEIRVGPYTLLFQTMDEA